MIWQDGSRNDGWGVINGVLYGQSGNVRPLIDGEYGQSSVL